MYPSPPHRARERGEKCQSRRDVFLTAPGRISQGLLSFKQASESQSTGGTNVSCPPAAKSAHLHLLSFWPRRNTTGFYEYLMWRGACRAINLCGICRVSRLPEARVKPHGRVKLCTEASTVSLPLGVRTWWTSPGRKLCSHSSQNYGPVLVTAPANNSSWKSLLL